MWHFRPLEPGSILNKAALSGGDILIQSAILAVDSSLLNYSEAIGICVARIHKSSWLRDSVYRSCFYC